MPVDPRAAAALAPLVPALLRRDGDALALLDASGGTWLHADAPLAEWLGLAAQGVAGQRTSDLFDGDTAAALRAAAQAALAASEAVASEHRLTIAGAKHEYSVLRQRIAAADGTVFLAEVWRDLTGVRRRDAQLRAAIDQLEQEQRANEELRRETRDASLHDRATGLYHSAHFEDQLRREVDLSTREHREFALVAIEVDALSPEAQALGEPARARILETLGKLLRSNTRAMDASCRVEGTRFAVLLSGVGLATAHSRMEGLRRQCATQIVAHEGREIGFTVSMGVASFPHTAATQDELRVACDSALADACARGGNRVTLASIRFDTGA